MQFRIADTFTDSLAKLTGDEQKSVKTTAFDLQMNPASPGMQFHKLDRARDKNFWSVRVGRDIRLIVHKTDASLLLCYVDHHDAAYSWAERRKIERHPKTGAAQLVEIRETVQEIAIPKYVEVEAKPKAQRRLFETVAAETLLSYGVPEEWLDDVRLADEDSLFDVVGHLPGEAAEALIELATGGTPRIPQPIAAIEDPFKHPDAERRFRIMADAEELAQALNYPWERWAIFLHPGQRNLVEREYNGPARVAGTAGTGKTVVALHRAVHLAKKHPDARVLVTTFNEMLANSLRGKLWHLADSKPSVLERIEVYGVRQLGIRLFTARFGQPNLVGEGTLRELLTEAAKQGGTHRFSDHFIWTEWNDVVDAWQLATWEEYRDVQRLGRKTRLAEPQRKLLWEIFANIRKQLEAQQFLTAARMFQQLTESIGKGRPSPYDFAIVDEAQDIGVPELRFFAAFGAARPDALFFSGDLGQRIFQPPFSWKSLGVDIRGRSSTLRVNYRTSHQIRTQADRLLPSVVADVDGNAEQRGGAISAFDGPEPVVTVFPSVQEETLAVAAWLKSRIAEGRQPHDLAVIVRSEDQFERASEAARKAGIAAAPLVDNVEAKKDHASILTMHTAKGLEYPAIAVIACDDEVLPSQERISAVADDSDLEEVYNTERHLLYVACTRARDHLFVSGVEPASEFLDDLCSKPD